MRRAKAYDKQSREFIGFKHADGFNEAVRYAYDLRCPEQGCDCSVHWRKQVHAKENTDIRPATFVKNRSSSHAAGCFQDYERIARENSAYTFFKDGAFHVRINFPLGTSNRDRFPMRGYLTEQQIAAANDRKDIKPFSTLKELVRFIEKNLGELDGPDLPDLVMNYQGHKAKFDGKMIGNMAYAKLYGITTLEDRHKNTAVTLSIVRPAHEIKRNENGKRRFVCASQPVEIFKRAHRISPVIVAYDDAIAEDIAAAAKKKEILCVVTRPFSPGWKPGHRETSVYLNVAQAAQYTRIDEKYWRKPQLELFPERDLPPHKRPPAAGPSISAGTPPAAAGPSPSAPLAP
ncbi:MAG: hypothetical protein WC989_06660 [Micavibrio sp.]